MRNVVKAETERKALIGDPVTLQYMKQMNMKKAQRENSSVPSSYPSDGTIRTLRANNRDLTYRNIQNKDIRKALPEKVPTPRT